MRIALFLGAVHEAVITSGTRPGPEDVKLMVHVSDYGGKKTKARWSRDKLMLRVLLLVGYSHIN